MLRTKFQEYRPTGSGTEDDFVLHFLAFVSMAAMFSMQPRFHEQTFILPMQEYFK